MLDLVRYGANSVTASSRRGELVSLDAARRLHLRQTVIALPQGIMAASEYKISWLVPPVSSNYPFITVNQQQ